MVATLAPVDPNAKVPPAAMRAAARADEIHGQVYKKDPPETPPVVEPAPVVVPPVAAEPPAPNTAPPVTPPGNEPPPAENFEHMYKSLKGRFDKMEPAYRDLSNTVTNLQNVIASLQATPSAPTTVAPSPVKLITDKEVEDYGQDLLSVVGKRAREELSPEVAFLKNQVADLSKQMEGVNARVGNDARSNLLVTLDRDLPNWRDLNENPEFISWLGLPDVLSGAIRHELLKVAFERNDALRVKAFFNGFLASEAAGTPAPGAGPNSQAPGTPAAHKVPLEAFAAPGRAKTAAASVPAEKPIITRAQITDFYAAKAAGKWRGREAEADANERLIFEATRDGRIR